VGPRPASFKDFSTQYADAYEAANNAILIVAKKIGSYNPAIGEFRSYLHTSLENALKDILEADGYLPLSGSDIENEPDTTESDTDERVRQHKDDAFETMIRFIDTLPEIKRAAVYASAFGQILRPDLEGYGRNYADILAQMYNTTALYIRKLAAEGKNAAIKEVQRQGFNERSMSEVYMGALQARTPVRDINDEVLKAVGQLDEFQQFMLLRHLAGMVDENNDINNNNNNTKTVKTMSVWGDMLRRSCGEMIRKDEAETYLIEQMEDGKLKDRAITVLKNTFKDGFQSFARSIGYGQIEVDEKVEQWFSDDDALALQACAVQPFEFGGHASLNDMLSNLGVVIKVEPGIKHYVLPQELAKAWDKEEVELWESMPVRGEYISADNTIKLYPEEMHSEYNGERMSELLISTLAHEAMHAYFNRKVKKRNELPYVIPVEEPMAEFGMLLYLHETKTVSYYEWACDDVCAKKTCYRYGHALMQQHLKETKDQNSGNTRTRKDLESYKRKLL
jgi:hypothetical protein